MESWVVPGETFSIQKPRPGLSPLLRKEMGCFRERVPSVVVRLSLEMLCVLVLL